MKRRTHVLTARLALCISTALLVMAPTPLPAQAQMPWSVDPEPVTAIGSFDEPGPYLFESVRYGLFLPDGGFVIADAGALAIRIYGPAGDFRTEMGGRGEGPGEFEAIGGLWLTNDNRIGAWDGLTSRITVFNLDGSLQDSSTPAADGFGDLQMYLGSFSDDDVLLASLKVGRGARAGQSAADRVIMGRFRLSGEFRAPLGEARGLRRLERQVQPFSPTAFVVIHGDSIYVADGAEPQIAVLDDGGARVGTIGLAEVPASSGDPWSSLESELVERNRDFYLQLLRQMPRADQYPAIGGLLVDKDQDLIWTKTFDPTVDSIWLKQDAQQATPGGQWQLVRPSGHVVATLAIPGNVVPLDVREDRLLGVARDALDVERVVVHLIQR